MAKVTTSPQKDKQLTSLSPLQTIRGLTETAMGGIAVNCCYMKHNMNYKNILHVWAINLYW